MKRAPELLAPAGTLKHVEYAFAYGADAVYAGQPRYSLRVRNNDFKAHENLNSAIELAHSQNKLFFLASNISPHNDKVKSYLKDLAPIAEMKPDALIMSDPGLIMMVRKQYPDLPIHLSVQANAVNYATVNFWKDMGLQRVILSRELSLDEVEDIRQRCPDIELEVFVHGALCIAYSGRCLLSGYMNHRDSNQGACTNACRWKYNTAEGKETPEGNVIAKTPEVFDPKAETTDDGKVKGIEDKVFLLEEATRPGEYMPAFEDEHGTYIMNSKDLRAVQHVNRFVDMGMDSLKIEGRTKSFFYVSRAVQVYRQAIDNAMSGKPFDINLMDNLESLANRGYTEGFYRRHVKDELQNYETGNSLVDKQQFVGEVLDVDAQGKLVVDVKNRFKVGDKIELMTPKGNHVFHLDGIETEKGESMDLAPGSGWVVKIPVPGGVDPDKALVMRTL